MKNKKHFPVTNIGTVSLLMIFIVLCMITFAALSLSESSRDYQFSEQLAQHTTEYYKASNEAQENLKSVSSLLTAADSNTATRAEYLQYLQDGIAADEKLTAAGTALSSDDRDIFFTWQCPMNDTQALYVELKAEGATYQITAWQEIQTTEWEGSNSLHLIDPQMN